jgi:signal transduction histidine kinase
MRNLKKLFLNPSAVIAFIIVCFACIVMLFQYYDYHTKRLLMKNAEAHQLTAQWDTLLSCTKDLLVSNDLHAALHRWKGSIADFDRSLNTFIQSDLISRLMRQNPGLRVTIEDTENLWQVMKPRIESVKLRFDEYLSQGGEKSGVSKRSLLHELLYQMEQSSRSTEYMQLFDLTYDIEYMVSSLSDYFVDTMRSMIEILRATMERETWQVWFMAVVSTVLVFGITIFFIIMNQRALNITTGQLRFLSNQLLMVEEKERKRVAQELHDEIGQSLTGIKYAVDNAHNLIAGGKTAESMQALERVVTLIRNAIEEARRISVSLHPAIIDQLGIIATISWYCREYRKIYSDIRLEQHIAAREADIPDRLKIIIYRILQETLTNVAKHSNAEQVHVTLSCRDGRLILVVQDNGPGFNPGVPQTAGVENHGFGLLSLRERVEVSGGEFGLRAAQGKGTKITVTWRV